MAGSKAREEAATAALMAAIIESASDTPAMTQEEEDEAASEAIIASVLGLPSETSQRSPPPMTREEEEAAVAAVIESVLGLPYDTPIPQSSRPSQHASAAEPIQEETAKQTSRPNKRKSYYEDKGTADAPIDLSHSPRVSKAARSGKEPQRRPNIARNVSSAGLPSSSGEDAAEPPPPLPARVAPRRNERLQPPVPSPAHPAAETVSTNPLNRTIQSRPEQNVASNPARARVYKDLERIEETTYEEYSEDSKGKGMDG